MINFISVDNGVGLSRDMKLFAEIAGIKYNFVNYMANTIPPHAETNIFFEVCRKNQLNARRNIIIPNPEWFASEWLSFVDRFDLVLCKTHHCQEVFSKYVGSRAVYIGWTSEDRRMNSPKVSKFLHVMGKSETKGTRSVHTAFTNHHVEELLITTSKPQKWLTSNQYVTVSNHRLTDEHMRQVQNSFAFHVCPSEYEGFGHYINEALSCGAIVLTLDAPPMNELCRTQFAKLIPALPHRHMGIVKTWTFEPHRLAMAARECMEMSAAEINRMSLLAREAYEQGRIEFIDNVKKLKL